MISYRGRQLVRQPAPALVDLSAPAVVIGVDGSQSSYRAVEFAATAIRDTAPLVVVGAVHRAAPDHHRSRRELAWCDALGADAYQLEQSTIVDEVHRTAREIAHRAGALHIDCRTVEGAAHNALLGVARAIGTPTIVVGCDGEPGRVARHLALAGMRVVLVADSAFGLAAAAPRTVGFRWRRSALAAPQ